MNARILCLAVWLLPLLAIGDEPSAVLSWNELPELPDELGVAGPFAGIHNDALIVAGGANFPKPVWDNAKAWYDTIHVLVKHGDAYVWKEGGKLPRPTAYGAAVSTSDGVVCIGGNDASGCFDEVFRLAYDSASGRIDIIDYPPLPSPCAFSAAALVGDVIYVAGGQSGPSLETAMNNFWSLDLANKHDPVAFKWKQHQAIPWSSRALNLTVSQHHGSQRSIYVISGRRQAGEETEFLKDVWQYELETNQWRRRCDAPRSVMAGVAMDHGASHVFVLGGADGSLFHRGDELRDHHPGFPKQALAYHTITDTWTSAGPIPQNHVTTVAVKWEKSIIVPSGEVRPRVRSPKIWKVTPVEPR